MIKRNYNATSHYLGYRIWLYLAATLLPILSIAQEHPRGMLTVPELQALRQQAMGPHYLQQVRGWAADKAEMMTMPVQLPTVGQAYHAEQQITRLAIRYATTTDADYAAKAGAWVQVVMRDTLVWHNPLVKGLTRAALLKAVATAYDFCYPAWPATLRDSTSAALLETARSLHSLMGTEANFALESNWMGVRYAAVLYALCISDHSGKVSGKQSEKQLLIWDAGERLRDHIKANMNPHGWSGESLGYHYYSWSFIGPALMAYEHRGLGRGKALAVLAPYCQNVIATHATVIAYIRGMGPFKALKPDFSDDNINVRPEFFLQAFRLYPEALHGPLRWMVDAMGHRGDEEALFYHMAWYPWQLPAVNPATAGWLHTVEAAQGVVAFRNRFQDSTDIVAAFTTTAKRIRAHQSGDNLSFRLQGLDNIWVVGGGRTPLHAGQPTVFATDSISLKERYQGGATGQLYRFGFYTEGGGYALGAGSCMGVQEHRRFFEVSYDSTATGAVAVVHIQDTSTNGKTWRLTTPEWNTVTPLPDGFLITAPNGATLRATVLGQASPLQVTTSRVPYNGTTTENAAGIPYKGKQYPASIAIDVPMPAHLAVVLTLQPAGHRHPQVRRQAGGGLWVGQKKLAAPDWMMAK